MKSNEEILNQMSETITSPQLYISVLDAMKEAQIEAIKGFYDNMPQLGLYNYYDQFKQKIKSQ